MPTSAATPRWWHRSARAVLLVAVALGTLLPAAPAFAAPRVRDVTIDCAGDIVRGHVTLTDPEDGASIRVVLYGTKSTSRNAPRTQLGKELLLRTSRWENEVGYSFTLPNHDYPYYRVKASIGSTARTSAAVGDPTCGPPTSVPEAGLAGLLLLVMGATAGGVYWMRSRRLAPAESAIG